MEKHFNLEYPDAVSLSMKYYDDENFNRIRRCKLILFSHCLGDNDTFKKKLVNNEIIKKNTLIKTRFLLNSGLSEESLQLINTYLIPVCLTKEHIIKYLERGCLNRSIEKSKTYNIRCVWTNEKFIDLYHSICYKVSCNIDSTSSVESNYIIQKIMNNGVKSINVANMTSKELCPKKYEQLDKKLNKRTNLERKIKFSEMYRCSKCKRNQTTTERRYARSWDEGTDLTINCVNCGYSWNG
jgi:DNA-directed RNA polymerase subunit M/transcription elongation factor TFIIS